MTDPDDVVARALNGCPKYVVSSTLQTTDWARSAIVAGDVVSRIRELKDQPGRDRHAEFAVSDQGASTASLPAG